MPSFEAPEQSSARNATVVATNPDTSFPPVTRDHILHCSYDYWFPLYCTSCIRSRIIRLPPEFIDYIREDGIILADDSGHPAAGTDDEDDWEPTSTALSPALLEQPEDGSDDEEDEEEEKGEETAGPPLPPNKRFSELHQNIKDAIKVLGGEVAPKLNWSSPRDAAWISMHQNTVKCMTPNDIYILLKSSNFITHDLDHAFDGTVAISTTPKIPAASSSSPVCQPVLVLRSYFTPHQALEFRCFVKQRSLVGITQRYLIHFAFLETLRPAIIARAKALFDSKLRFTFPDGNFCFDVYMPKLQIGSDPSDNPHDEHDELCSARLIDINPWAPRTDSLLFDWKELLDLHVPNPMFGVVGTDLKDVVLRLRAAGGPRLDEDETTTDEEEEDDFQPELRLVEKDDAAAYNLSSPQYSAHKLPKEVVDASTSGLREFAQFAQQWNDMMNRRI